MDDLNEKGEKREIPKFDKANRLKFLDACDSFDLGKRGVITINGLMTAFNRARLNPLPTLDQLKNLCKALEVFNTDDFEEVNFRKILEAPVNREF